MRTSRRDAGEIRVRTIIEIALIFIAGYMIFQIAPVVVLRMNFLNELEVIANSPIQESAMELRQKVYEAAEGYGIALIRENVYVQRDRELKKTIIDARYQLHINFFFSFVYTWNVEDHVEALLL